MKQSLDLAEKQARMLDSARRHKDGSLRGAIKRALKRRAEEENWNKGLNPGHPEYVVESMKPGVTKREAAKRAGLASVPNGKAVNRFRRALVQKQITAAEITAERIAIELARVAFSDPGRMFDGNGNMIPLDQMDEDTRRAISGFDVERRSELVYSESGGKDGKGGLERQDYLCLKPRMWNKNQALDTLARMHYDLDGRLKMPTDGGALTEMPLEGVDAALSRLVDGIAARRLKPGATT